MGLEKDIKNASLRIERRSTEIETEISDLDKRITSFSRWAWSFVIFGFLVTLFGIVTYFLDNTEGGYGLNLLGDFMAGTVASIWSLAGLFFIYVAFLGQKQQLSNQQLEIMYSQLEVKYTRLELAGQKEEMKLQNDTLKQQRFENTFFQQLNLFNSIINSIDLRDKDTKEVTTSGRDCFAVFHKRFRNNLSKIIYGKIRLSADLTGATVEQALNAYNDLYKKDRADLSHYFRTYYQIIKFIDNSEIENKRQYISIARAQLSCHEQIILFYNCLHANGREKFKPLIEKYSLWKDIDSLYISNKIHLKEYAESAYRY